MKYGGAGLFVSGGLFLAMSFATQAENLTTVGGVTYTDITISKVEPDGIRILHSGGAARIPASQLSAHFKQQHSLTNFVATLTPPVEAPQTIVTLDGKTYAKSIIKRIEPDRLFIVYEEGATVLEFTNLSADMQKKYGYDPVKAQAMALKREADEKARVEKLLGAKNTASSPHPGTPPPVAIHPIAIPAAAPAPTPTPEPKAVAPSETGKSIALVDLVQLAESIDLAREEERSRLGGTVNWRPPDDYYDYWYWYYANKRGENAARQAKQAVASGNRATWSTAVAQAREMLKQPADIPPIKSWLEKFIKTSELAGTRNRDDYHRRCKELLDDLDFLLKADAKP